MANIETWTSRIAAWRASGLTAIDFSAGKEFAAGTLLWWSCRLAKLQKSAALQPSATGAGPLLTPAPTRKVQLARVVRRGKVASPPAAQRGEVSVIVEVGAVRVVVPTGADAITFNMVLQAIGLQAAGGVR